MHLGVTLGDIDAMPNDEIAAWYQYYQTNRPPLARIEYLLAVLLAFLYNKNSKGRRYKPDDFILGGKRRKPKPKDLTGEELMGKFRSVFSGGNNPST